LFILNINGIGDEKFFLIEKKLYETEIKFNIKNSKSSKTWGEHKLFSLKRIVLESIW
jgi:hypothetical protein